MQKKLIALAVAGLASTGAFAQVTMYGIVDNFVASGKSTTAANTDTKFMGVGAGGLSGSRLGFDAAEDLGDGMKAVAKLEFGSLATDGSAGITGTRQNYVGLAGGFGVVAAGRFNTSGFDFVGNGLLGASALDPMTNFTGSSTQINSGSRVNNAVAYLNNFGPVALKAAYSFVTETETTGGASPARAANLGLRYAQGPLAVEGVYIAVTEAAAGTAGALDKSTDLAVQASYNLGVAVLAAQYVNTTVGYKGPTTQADIKTTTFALDAAIPVGAKGTVAVGYASSKADTMSDAATGLGVAYLHAAGKRTTIYGGYYTGTSGKLSAGETKGLVQVGSVGGTAVAGEKADVLAAGVRLTF